MGGEGSLLPALPADKFPGSLCSDEAFKERPSETSGWNLSVFTSTKKKQDFCFIGFPLIRGTSKKIG